MISYVNKPNAADVIKHAMLDDVSPLKSGEVVEYWIGETELEYVPSSKRAKVFNMVRKFIENGRVIPFQVPACIVWGGARKNDTVKTYSYRFKVV